MKPHKVLLGLVAVLALAAGVVVASFATPTTETAALAEPAAETAPRAPRRAMTMQRQPAPPAESTRVYVDPSTRLQTGPDGVTPLHYDCSFHNGEVQECWCDTPLDCKDMILNSPCTEDDAWWTSGDDTLGCTIQD